MTMKPVAQYRYAVEVLATSASGRQVALLRSGGGGKLGLDDAYYPTSIWIEQRGGRQYCYDPSRVAYAWGMHGPDAYGPYTVLEAVRYHESPDPMGASTTGFASELTEAITR